MSAAPAKSRLGRGLGGLIAKAALPPPPASPTQSPAPAAAPSSAKARPAAAAPTAVANAGKNSAKAAPKKSPSRAAGKGGAVKRAAAGDAAKEGAAPAAKSPPAKAAAARSPAAPVPESVSPAVEKTLDRGLTEYLEIPVGQIEPSPYQARRVFTPESLSELAESIRSEGLLQPIVVREVAGRYQLVAGERRWRAFQALRLKTIPARVVEAGDASSAALGLIENLQRDGLNPIEEAHGFASLIRDFDLTQEAAAARVGRSRASIANTLRLLSLDEELQGYVARNLFSTGHAKVLLGVEDAAQRALLARRVIEEGLSVRATERLVQEAGKPSRAAPGSRKSGGSAHSDRDAEAVAAIEQRLTSRLGARVAVLHTPKKGRIVIEYRGNEDLQRVLEKLGVEL